MLSSKFNEVNAISSEFIREMLLFDAKYGFSFMLGGVNSELFSSNEMLLSGDKEFKEIDWK